jgi:hypothetical protein
MIETPEKEYVTVSMFNEFRAEFRQGIDELKQFMMECFAALDRKIDYVDEHLSSRIDEIVVRIEKKIA